jgi:hypothetical protein
MHIMINGNFLSLDNIITISAIRYPDGYSSNFNITYQTGREVVFYYTPEAKEKEGELWYSAFYFKDKSSFERCHKNIIQILTDAAKSITTS